MNSFRSGMNSFQIEIMENCGDKVRNEFIPDRNEFIPVNFFHSATVNCAQQKYQWIRAEVIFKRSSNLYCRLDLGVC